MRVQTWKSNKLLMSPLFGRSKLRARHLKAFIKHNTLKKFMNFMAVERERMQQRMVLKGFPYMLTVDVTNICNLQCRFCPTGKGQYGRPKGLMSFGNYQRVLDELEDYLYIVNLFNWGEPLLNPEIYRMISYAKNKNLSTCISTNLNKFSEDEARKMVSSGLEHLIISLDGASEETYSIYQKGGKFSDVVRNIETLINIREDMKCSNPHITWYFLVFRHNEHEIDKARELACKLGINEIDLRGGGVEDPSWLSNDHSYRRTGESEEIGCNWLWRNLTVNWDGGISPCCWAFEKEDDLGISSRNPSARFGTMKISKTLGAFSKEGILIRV